jgi:asparagine synthase (glutamine-hydrolysing)
VSLIPPATAWEFAKKGGERKLQYFQREAWEQQPRLSEPEFYEKLKATFSRVLPRYFAGEGSVGIALTGGLDSRMIMAWNACQPNTLPCYTFGGTYRDSSDVAIGRLIAESCSQAHRVVPIDGVFLSKFGEMAEKAVYLSDGAMDVTGAVELFANKVAREIAPVRITGNYGSEILRGNVAFGPQALNESVFDSYFVEYEQRAIATYQQERLGNLLSFIAFKQVPWHHHSRLAVERSQVTMRSPFLDNEVVALAYRAPQDAGSARRVALRLIAEGRPALARIPTDRGLVYPPMPVLTRLMHCYQELTFKAEYAYDYGMPQWLVLLDHIFSGLRLERVFLGRHKFYHFRVWYRDRLRQYLKGVLLDPRSKSRPHLNKAKVEKLVDDHVSGARNYTCELHQLLSIELIYRLLIEQ